MLRGIETDRTIANGCSSGNESMKKSRANIARLTIADRAPKIEFELPEQNVSREKL
jgi:hypothetical protein